MNTEPCPCGRMNKPTMLWLCRCCYLEKEIRYALSELERGCDPTWRLARLVGWDDPRQGTHTLPGRTHTETVRSVSPASIPNHENTKQ